VLPPPGGSICQVASNHRDRTPHPNRPRRARGFGSSWYGAKRSRLRPLATILTPIAVWLTIAQPSQAELTLSWEAPPGCSTKEQVLKRLRALAGPIVDQTTGLLAEGRVTRDGQGFVLELWIRDGSASQRRTMTARVCADLAGAAAVTLALTLGADGPEIASRAAEATTSAAPLTSSSSPIASGAPPEPVASASAATASTTATTAPTRPGSAIFTPATSVSQAATGSNWLLALRAPSLLFDVGPLRDPSIGLGTAAGLRRGSFRALAGAQYYPEQRLDIRTRGVEAGTRFHRTTARLSACYGWRSGAYEITPCGELAALFVEAEGFGTGVSRETRRAVWLAPGLTVTPIWHLSASLALFANLGALLDTSRPRIVIDGLGQVTQLEPVVWTAAVGAEWAVRLFD